MAEAASSAERAAELRIGASGWSYPDWVGPFYPEGTPSRGFLESYATRFDAVEVDSTFYAVPAASTFAGWAARTPDGFLFAPKVPGLVTHGAEGERARVDRVLTDEGGHLETFLERASLLGEKLGCVLFQFPYFRVKEFEPGDFLGRLDRALARVPPAIRVAVEVRNKTWLGPELFTLLRAHRAAAALIDHPYMPPPAEQLELGMVTTDFAYIRLLGDRYKIEETTKTWGAMVVDRSRRIAEWGDVIRAIATRREIGRVFAFSNNHFAGHAPSTCAALSAVLRAGPSPSGTPSPPSCPP